MSASRIQECTAEMKCFVRGGVPGIARLFKVYPNIFTHYEITDGGEKYAVFYDCLGRHKEHLRAFQAILAVAFKDTEDGRDAEAAASEEDTDSDAR